MFNTDFGDFIVSGFLLFGLFCVMAGIAEAVYWIGDRFGHPELADRRADDQLGEGGIPR